MKRMIFLALAAFATIVAQGRECNTCSILKSDDAAKTVAEAPDLGRLLEVADSCFFQPGAPCASEEAMGRLLEAALASGRLDDTERSVAEWKLGVCRTNAVGTPAADFQFYLADRGGRYKLSGYRQGEPMIIIFYDPDCRTCSSKIRQLTEAELPVPVLAVCVENTENRWIQTRDALPASWDKAFDLSDLMNSETYVIRGLPSIYLLDGKHNVVLKNPSISLLLDQLKGGTR